MHKPTQHTRDVLDQREAILRRAQLPPKDSNHVPPEAVPSLLAWCEAGCPEDEPTDV